MPVTGSPGGFSAYGVWFASIENGRPTSRRASGGAPVVGTPWDGTFCTAMSLPSTPTSLTSNRSSGRGGGPEVTRPSELYAPPWQGHA